MARKPAHVEYGYSTPEDLKHEEFQTEPGVYVTGPDAHAEAWEVVMGGGRAWRRFVSDWEPLDE